MQVIQHSKDILPKSQYCVFLPHEQLTPYVNGWNYLNLVLPNITRYCEEHDIDLILLTNFKREMFPQKVDIYDRITDHLNIVALQLLDIYKYVFVYMSDLLIKKNMPHVRDLMPTGTDCLVPFDTGVLNLVQSGNTPSLYIFQPAHPKHWLLSVKHCFKDINDLKKSLKFYQNAPETQWWPGPGIVINKKMKEWFNVQNIHSFAMHDIAYRFSYHSNHSEQYNLHFNKQFGMQQLQWIITQIIKVNNLTNYNQVSIMKYIQKIDLTSYLEMDKFKLIHFGACGSYTPLWRLRYLLIRHITLKYKDLVW